MYPDLGLFWNKYFLICLCQNSHKKNKYKIMKESKGNQNGNLIKDDGSSHLSDGKISQSVILGTTQLMVCKLAGSLDKAYQSSVTDRQLSANSLQEQRKGLLSKSV